MKKEKYFTSQNIDKESDLIIKKIGLITRIQPFEIDISKSALIILDMQKFFLSPSSHAQVPSANFIIKNIQHIVEYFNEKQRPVIFTKHINTNDNAGLMASFWKDTIKIDEIIEDFNISNSILIEKSQYDAFYNTNLENLLVENNTENLVVTGVMTHLCCETTARSAFIRGIQPIFVVDATATYNRELHFSSCLNVAHGFGPILKTKDLIKCQK
ncbi:MAG: isochorismatase family protein [Candidatus Gastranaerophilales bacterium]|nr:isochorismatase family protein [Candidatus Gastranaerophilales bacterium]